VSAGNRRSGVEVREWNKAHANPNTADSRSWSYLGNPTCRDDPTWRGDDQSFKSKGLEGGCHQARHMGGGCDDQGSNFYRAHSKDGVSVKCACLQTCGDCDYAQHCT
jgi:hypothetical protein